MPLNKETETKDRCKYEGESKVQQYLGNFFAFFQNNNESSW